MGDLVPYQATLKTDLLIAFLGQILSQLRIAKETSFGSFESGFVHEVVKSSVHLFRDVTKMFSQPVDYSKTPDLLSATCRLATPQAILTS